MQKHSTLMDATSDKTMATSDEQTHSSNLGGLQIKLGKSQDPISWFCCNFDAMRGFTLDRNHIAPLIMSKTKWSFVEDALDQIKQAVLDHMFDTLIKCCADQGIEWNQTFDL